MNSSGEWATNVITWFATPPVAVQERMYEWEFGMHPMWWTWGASGIVMMIMMLVFWGLVIAGVVIGIRWLVTQEKGPGPDSALQILRERSIKPHAKSPPVNSDRRSPNFTIIR